MTQPNSALKMCSLAGEFAIRPDKKKEPAVKKAKKLGMIAGGTGKILFNEQIKQFVLDDYVCHGESYKQVIMYTLSKNIFMLEVLCYLDLVGVYVIILPVSILIDYGILFVLELDLGLKGVRWLK